MVDVINLRLPATWITTEPNRSSFPISADQLDDDLEATGNLDWGNLNFINVGTINGFTPSAGGGSIDLETTGLFREEFHWNEFSGVFNERIEGNNGELDNPSNRSYGHGLLLPNGPLVGEAGDIGTGPKFQAGNANPAFGVDFALGDIEFLEIIRVLDTTNTLVLCGWINDDMFDNTSQAGIFAQANFVTLGFVSDSAVSANWQIFSQSSPGNLTISTTTVPVTTNLVKLKVVYVLTPTPSAQFFIDGTSVGTITTDLPPDGQQMYLTCYLGNKTVGDKEVEIDTFEIKCTRGTV